jgi:hypothetical protein
VCANVFRAALTYPFPYNHAHPGVLDFLVLLRVFKELDEYEWIDLASPRLLAVHAFESQYMPYMQILSRLLTTAFLLVVLILRCISGGEVED